MAKQNYRFIGAEAQVGRIKMERFGQRFAMDEKVGDMVRKGGCPLLTEEEFSTFEFSDAQLKDWTDPFIDQFEVPADSKEAEQKADFLEKKAAALAYYCEVRHGLLEPQSRPNTAVSTAAAAVDEPIVAIRD